MSSKEAAIIILTISVVLILSLIFFIVYIVYLHRRSARRFLLEMEETKTLFHTEILKSQLEMQENTFEFISMEIHDNVGQLLSLSKLNLNRINNATPEVLGKIGYSVELLTQALTDLRNMSRRLDPDIIRRAGLQKAIENFVGLLRKSTALDIQFDASGFSAAIQPETEIILFRILQEAVMNAIKHAEPTRIILRLHIQDDHLLMEISDNGVGFDPVSTRDEEGGDKAGIKNMEKRASMINGRLQISSDQGAGTSIRVSLPLG